MSHQKHSDGRRTVAAAWADGLCCWDWLISVQYCLQVSADGAGMGLTNFTERAWRRLNSWPDVHWTPSTRLRRSASVHYTVWAPSPSPSSGHKSVLTMYCLPRRAMNALNAHLLRARSYTHLYSTRRTDKKNVGDLDEHNSHAMWWRYFYLFIMNSLMFVYCSARRQAECTVLIPPPCLLLTAQVG